MPRSEVVKKMWQIIKSRNLQDPENKQYFIVRDPDVRKVFSEYIQRVSCYIESLVRT